MHKTNFHTPSMGNGADGFEMVSNSKHKQVLYRKLLYKSSEIVKKHRLIIIIYFKNLIQNIKWYKSKYAKNYCKKRVLGYFVCALLPVVMKRMHLTGGYRTFSTSFIRQYHAFRLLMPTGMKLICFQTLHNYLNTKSLIMGFWLTIIYKFISLKTKSQTECTEN